MSEERSIRVAVATSADGASMERVHFGRAPKYAIYELGAEAPVRLGTIDNPHGGDHGHGHHAAGHHGRGPDGQGHGHGLHPGRRAGKIMSLLAEQGAEVVVSQAFGRNVMKIKTAVVPVVVASATVDEALGVLGANREAIIRELDAGDARKHLVFRS